MNLHHIKPLKVKFVALLATAVVLATAAPASAGSFDPAYRGDANSVHAIFDWVSIPATDWATSLFEPGPSAFPLDPTDPSAFDDGENTTIILPNFIDPLDVKFLRIQMGFDGEVNGSLIAMDVVGHDPEGAVAIEVNRSDGFSHEHFIDWEIYPNPDWEEILLLVTRRPTLSPATF